MIKELNLDEHLICSTMGYVDVSPSEELLLRVEELLHDAKSVSNPSFYFCIHSDIQIATDEILVNNICFKTGKTIAKLLQGSSQVAVFVATAGYEFQTWASELKKREDCLDIFIADTIGSCIAEATGDAMERHLEKEIEILSHSNRFSPGYCGWDLKEQQKLFALLPKNTCNISLSDNCLMNPMKSISGIIGIGTTVKRKVYSCDICQKKGCYQSKFKRNKEAFSR